MITVKCEQCGQTVELYTVEEAATQLSLTPRGVRFLTPAPGRPGHGQKVMRDWLFTAGDITAMRGRQRRGRPKELIPVYKPGQKVRFVRYLKKPGPRTIRLRPGTEGVVAEPGKDGPIEPPFNVAVDFALPLDDADGATWLRGRDESASPFIRLYFMPKELEHCDAADLP